MSEIFRKKEDKKEALKELLKKLHEGVRPEKVKEEFKDILKGIEPKDIAEIEEELIKEGIKREEIQRLCEVHLAVFRESLEKEISAEVGHPINILMEEHKILLQFADKLKNISDEKLLSHIIEHFKESEKHYLREENVLFPYLEKHGVTQPPAIMWMEHDKIREIKKNLYKIVDTESFKDNPKQLQEVANSLYDMLSSHFYKENNILFPTSLKVIEEKEWIDIRKQFDEIGYCCFTPENLRVPVEIKEEVPAPEVEMEGMISFETGNLSKEEIESILNNLPVDITFVDKEDTVRYFSQSKERIFPRTKAVIGRKVQNCHPEKSIHIVNQILNDFRSGKRDVAEFWIDLKGRLIYIRYFAVRSKNGDYLGCLEVTQDITEIKKIEGEKRLL